MTTRAIQRRPSRLRSPIHIAVLTLFAAAAQAQSQEAPAPAAAASAPARTATEAPSATLETVTVTATKRTTSLQRTPVAVTSLSASDLDKAHVQTIQDVVHLVPSFQATSQGDHGVITLTLRGIGNDSAKTEYADPEVALFVDGIYAPRAEGAAALLFDMEAIEVLRGPQGTLWGRNSTVGAVNMQTAKPVLGEKSGNVEAGLGNYSRFGTRGAFNIPLGDTLALRFAFAHEKHDGYVDYQAAPTPSLASQQAAAAPVIAAWNTAHPANPIAFQPINPNLFTQGGQKYGAQDQTAARLSLLWKPSSALSWNISYEQFLDRGTPNMNLMQEPRAGQDFWSALIDTAPSLKRDVHTVRSRVDYALNPDMALAYVAGYSRFTGSGTFDQDGGATVPTSFTTGATYQEDRTNWSKYTNYSHELTLQSTGKRQLDWILGLYYAAEDNGIRLRHPDLQRHAAGHGRLAGLVHPAEGNRALDRRLRPAHLERDRRTPPDRRPALHLGQAREHRRHQQRLDRRFDRAAGAGRRELRPARRGLGLLDLPEERRPVFEQQADLAGAHQLRVLARLHGLRQRLDRLQVGRPARRAACPTAQKH